MRSALLILAFVCSAVCQKPFEINLPVLSGFELNTALQHAQTARNLENNGQYQNALFEYVEVINAARRALGNNTDPWPDPTIYYVAGLAYTDSARMYNALNLSSQRSAEYFQYLANAEQSLRSADTASQRRGVSMWPVFAALSSVHILQGNLAAAQADIQQVQTLTPQYRPAAAAVRQVNAITPQLAQAAAATQSKASTITPAQRQLLEGLVVTVGSALLPEYKVGLTVMTAGFEFWQKWRQAGAPQ